MTAVMPRFKLVFFVPASALQRCKAAIFSAGAGRYQNYSECCFTSTGVGEFRPTGAANPHIGEVGTLERVEEIRVEAMCVGREVAVQAVEALKKAHPYEEPAYEIYKLEDL